MSMKVVNAFVLGGKTYLPGTEVKEEVFLGQEAIMLNFLKLGFLTKRGNKAEVVATAPVRQLPKAVEIKNQDDLRKAVEGDKPEKKQEVTQLEVKPVVENEVVKIESVEEKVVVADENKIEIQPPTQVKGKARRS